jgi:flagellar motor switch protein FliG
MASIMRRGIDAYRQTMKQSPAQPETPVGGTPPTAGGAKGLLKETVLPAEPKVRRVAKFLILVGQEQAAKILGELDGDQIEEISREIASIKGVGPEEAEAILAEFKSLLVAPWKAGFGPSCGGVEAARRMLYAVYGPEKGEALLNKSVPESKENIFSFLEEFEPEQLVFLLKDESPAAAALVLARLSPKASAQTLGKFPPALKPDILMRIAHQSEVAPEVLERVAGAMREKARFLGSGSKDIPIDGMQALAAILKQTDYSFGNRLMSELGTENPDIEQDLKSRLYTLDDVLAAYDRPLAEKIKAMKDRDVAMLLKGRSVAFREKILSNVSSGRRSVIREEYDVLGEVSKRECDEAANNFLAWFRMARENGELMLVGDEEWVV